MTRSIFLLAAGVCLLLIAGCPAASDTETPADGNAAATGGDGGGPSGSGEGASQLAGEIEVDGSSTVEPISRAVAVEFIKKYPNVKPTVAVSGTGGGFKRFKDGETDISDASRPIKDSEFSDCRANEVDFIELPVAFDGLSIVVNPKNDFVEELTIDDLKKIFLAPGAKTWKEVNPEWPAETIKIYAPGKDSGTYDYFFSDVVNKDGQGEVRDAGVSFNEDDNALVDGVARETYAIGFFGCSYYFANENRLKVVPIVDPETGKAVSPTPATIESGEYSPFSRPLFIYVNAKSLDSPAVKQFVEFYLNSASEMAKKVNYVALPDEIIERAYEHYENRLAGTHYLTPDLKKRSGPLAEIYVEGNLVKVLE